MHLLGFDVDLRQRTISYIPPDASRKIRDYASAGSTRLRLSGLQSRRVRLPLLGCRVRRPRPSVHLFLRFS